jgi:hypothetical protein
MRKILFLLLMLFSFCISYTAPFTPGNIVVVRLGDGSGALSNAGVTVFLDEYTTSGMLVQSVQLPTSLNGANKRFVNSGSATSEAFLTLSPNKQFLTLVGYDTIPGFASVASAAGINRVIALVNYQGTINTSTAFIDGYVTNNVRSVVTLDGTAFWVSGAGSSNTGGVRYITLGSSTSTQVSSSVTNTRVISIFGGQVWASSSSGAFLGVNKVGSGLPTGTGETVLSIINQSGSSSYGFAFNSDTSVCYVADDRSVPNGGVQKWTRSGSTWSLAYTLNTGLTRGCRGLTVDFDGANTVVYTVMDSTVSNRVFKTTDVGAASTFSAIVTAGSNQLIRGIAFAPIAPLPPAPASPNPLSPANNSTGNLTSLNLVWNKSAGATSYRVQLSIDSLFGSFVVNDSTLTDSIRTVSGLQPLTNYYWRVSAKNAGGTSTFSTRFRFRTLGVPAVISGTFVPANGTTGLGLTVNLRWPKAVDQVLDASIISSYWFEQVTDTAGMTNLNRDTTLTDTLKTVSGLANNVTYYWRVKAKNQIGWGSFTPWLRYSTAFIGISQYNSEIPAEYSLHNNYPNPFNPSTNIKFDIPKQGFVTLKVYDLLGMEVASLVQEVLPAGRYEVIMNAGNLASGVYFYSFNSNSFSSVKKMILVK